MKTIKQKISHAVSRHAKFVLLCCAVLCAALANATTYKDVLIVSYEGGLTPMATRSYSGSFSTKGIEKPDWIGATKIVVGGQGYGTASAKKVGSVAVTIE